VREDYSNLMHAIPESKNELEVGGNDQGYIEAFV
jgi:hypothetical protein